MRRAEVVSHTGQEDHDRKAGMLVDNLVEAEDGVEPCLD
jgi:hypothetical protein